MSQGSESKLPATGDLSSLMDGELDASAVGRACAQWRDDDEVRAQWHAYHVIGDVLRSEDLASGGAHDAAFLAAFRTRLAQEPVVLAPTPAAPLVPQIQPTRRRAWSTSAAVAAGFVAVAGVLVVTQMSGGLSLPGSQAQSTLAAAPNVAPAIMVADGAASATGSDLPAVVLNGQLIRDVRLDEYLAAHKKFGGSSVPGGPSGFLRNAAADGTAR
ncbi:MAG: sigma-E factor negative regulatory protein [Cytophagales bacterium]|nr:sigma-E factor negative regulatory protein [Rhizobacter sp.]